MTTLQEDHHEEKDRQEKLQKIKYLIEKDNILFVELYPNEAADLKLFYALEAAGVDNWEGYDAATEELYQESLIF
jgi:hypothetical protein